MSDANDKQHVQVTEAEKQKQDLKAAAVVEAVLRGVHATITEVIYLAGESPKLKLVAKVASCVSRDNLKGIEKAVAEYREHLLEAGMFDKP